MQFKYPSQDFEGTRSKTQHLRSGFYYIAKEAGVPVICANFNFKKWEYSHSEPIDVNNKSLEEVFEACRTWYEKNDLLDSGFILDNTTPFILKK